MKKFRNIVCCALCLAMAAALCACSNQNDIAKIDKKAQGSGDNTQIANPVRESSAEEFKKSGIVMPEIDGKTPVYTIIDGDEPLYQGDYGTFTVRAQKTDERTDISGMYYRWVKNDVSTLELLQGDPIFETDGSGAGIVYWYVADYSFSVGMTEGASVDTLKELYFAVFNANCRGAKPVVG